MRRSKPGKPSRPWRSARPLRLLQTDRVDIATTLSSKQILATPTYQRNFLSLEFITPGVLPNPASTQTSENPQGSFRARVNSQMWGTTVTSLMEPITRMRG